MGNTNSRFLIRLFWHGIIAEGLTPVLPRHRLLHRTHRLPLYPPLYDPLYLFHPPVPWTLRCTDAPPTRGRLRVIYPSLRLWAHLNKCFIKCTLGNENYLLQLVALQRRSNTSIQSHYIANSNSFGSDLETMHQSWQQFMMNNVHALRVSVCIITSLPEMSTLAFYWKINPSFRCWFFVTGAYTIHEIRMKVTWLSFSSTTTSVGSTTRSIGEAFMCNTNSDISFQTL